MSIPRSDSDPIASNLERHAFAARDTETVGFQCALTCPTFAFGTGTTGAKLVHGIASFLRREHGTHPATFEYLLVDAAAPSPGVDLNRFFQIGKAADGAGTDPTRGRELFRENYSDLRASIKARIERLSRPDPDLPTAVPFRQALHLWVFGGPGGTSGGGAPEAVTLLHDVALDLSIALPRVHLVQIGAEMPLRDKTHRVTVEQRLVVSNTALVNLRRVAADFRSNTVATDLPPDGTPIGVAACNRVYSLHVVDHSNGEFEFTTTDALIEMLARAYFIRMFTRVEQHIGQRLRDHNELHWRHNHDASPHTL